MPRIQKTLRRCLTGACLSMTLLTSCAAQATDPRTFTQEEWDAPVTFQLTITPQKDGGSAIHVTCSGSTPRMNAYVCDQIERELKKKNAMPQAPPVPQSAPGRKGILPS